MLSHKIIKLLIVSFVFTVFALAFPSVQHVLTGKEVMPITNQEVQKFTGNFTNENDGGAHYFLREAVLNVLYQEDVVGMRIDCAKREDGSPTFVIVGIDKYGKDVKSHLRVSADPACPPFCIKDTTKNPRPDFKLDEITSLNK